MATLLNHTVDGGRFLVKFKSIITKSCQRANAAKAMAEWSKAALSKAKEDLAIVRANLALEK